MLYTLNVQGFWGQNIHPPNLQNMSWGFRAFRCWHSVTEWVVPDICNDCNAFVFNDPALIFFPDWWTLHAERTMILEGARNPWPNDTKFMYWEYMNPWHSHCENLKCHNICKTMYKCDYQCLQNQQNSLSALMILELLCVLKASHNIHTLNNSVWFFLHLRVKV